MGGRDGSPLALVYQTNEVSFLGFPLGHLGWPAGSLGYKTHSQKAGIGMHVLGYGDQTPSGLPEYLEMMIKHPMNYCLNTRINIHMNYDEAVL
jgi:hypothetical protein